MSTRKTTTKKSATKKATPKRTSKSSTTKKRPSTKKKAPAKRKKKATAATSDADVTIDRRRTERREEEAASTEPKLERRKKVNRRRQIDPTTCERDYSDQEVEFMNALDDYKRKNGRMFPTCSEVLEVIRGLGYVQLSAAEIATRGVYDDTPSSDLIDDQADESSLDEVSVGEAELEAVS